MTPPPAPEPSAAPRRTVHAACPHDCPDTCAMLATVEGERLLSLRGNPAHPLTDGVLCTKVARYGERIAHPERVLKPLKRVGAKGEGRFVEAEWDEALDAIASRLQAIAARNPEAILPYSYAGTMGLLQGGSMASRFFHALGASQLDRTICASAGGAGLAATYGGKVGMRVEDFLHARLILIWGSNSIASNLHFWPLALKARRAGACLVCIDPRRTETAEKCDEHLTLRPGTDGALALALMHELFAHGWADTAWMAQHLDGEAALRARAAEWPPERAAAVCGLEVETIRSLARRYGTTRPAAIRANYGLQRVHGGASATRLIALLPCVTGAWQQRGGGFLLSSSGWAAPAVRRNALERPDLMPVPAPRTVNMSTIGDALLHPGDAAFGPRIEAVVVYNSNPVAVAPESPKVAAGFAREDLFTVVLEHFRTDTADHADWVLPATMQLEHWDVHTSYGHTDVLLNEPALPARGQALPNTEIFRRLARRMGLSDAAFQDDDAALVAQALDADQIDLARLRADGFAPLRVPAQPFAQGGFPTANGRAQAAPAGLGVADHVPNHECAEADPALAARYPLAMISPPARHFLNSTFVNVQSLRAIEGEPLLELHADDAAARGLADGDIALVHNDRGHYRCRVALNGRARPGVVHGLGVWWRKFGLDGANANEVTSQRLTDLGAAPTFYDCLVQVQRADAPWPPGLQARPMRRVGAP